MATVKAKEGGSREGRKVVDVKRKHSRCDLTCTPAVPTKHAFRFKNHVVKEDDGDGWNL